MSRHMKRSLQLHWSFGKKIQNGCSGCDGGCGGVFNGVALGWRTEGDGWGWWCRLSGTLVVVWCGLVGDNSVLRQGWWQFGWVWHELGGDLGWLRWLGDVVVIQDDGTGAWWCDTKRKKKGWVFIVLTVWNVK